MAAGRNTPDCPCDCDNSTDTGNTNPGGTGTTNPGGGHICICNCDDCADGTCGTTRYYKPGESFCLYNASHSDLYAWSTEPSIIFVGTDGKAVAIREGSAYICIRSRSNPAFRRCIRVVATNIPPTQPSSGSNGTNNLYAAPEFHHEIYTFQNRTVILDYIKCNYNQISVKSISGSVKDSGLYGINGTFFAKSHQTLLGIAINDGQIVRNYGGKNRDPLETGENNACACGTFFVLKEAVNGTILGTDIIDIYDGHIYRNNVLLSIANTRFAIGGSSLFTQEPDLTENVFNRRLANENAPYSGKVSRTAIIYIGGSSNGLNTILLTVYGSYTEVNGNNIIAERSNGVTLWELRSLINNRFSQLTPTGSPIVHAIALDGGGSTQIAYKDENGTRKTCQASNENRSVYSMLSISM